MWGLLATSMADNVYAIFARAATVLPMDLGWGMIFSENRCPLFRIMP